jgi:hypothetical protein
VIHRCQSCSAAIPSGRGWFHDIGVAVANPSRKASLRIVRVLTCLAAYCISRKNQIAAAA